MLASSSSPPPAHIACGLLISSLALLAASPQQSAAWAIEPSRQQLHLLVFAHGLGGHADDWSALTEALRARLRADPTHSPPRVSILLSTANTDNTLDGIAAGGLRLALEIARFTLARSGCEPYAPDDGDTSPDHLCLMRQQLQAAVAAPQQLHLTIVGHSLGGLYARAALGYLLQSGWLVDDEEGGGCAAAPLIPAHYYSVSTPHLGVVPSSHEPGLGLVSLVRDLSLRWLAGQTGLELALADERALLRQMAQPSNACLRALALFRTRTTVAIPDGDLLVPYHSAAVGEPAAGPRQRRRLVQRLHEFSALDQLGWDRVAFPFPARYFPWHHGLTLHKPWRFAPEFWQLVYPREAGARFVHWFSAVLAREALAP